MTTKWLNSPAVIWCCLCALTVMSVTLVDISASRNSIFAVIIVVIAAVKSRLVILHFMEATSAAPHWRFLYETWNFAAAATICIGYLRA